MDLDHVNKRHQVATFKRRHRNPLSCRCRFGSILFQVGCEASYGTLWLAEGERFRSVAVHNLPPALAEQRRREPVQEFAPATGIGRVVESKRVAYVEDMLKDPAYLASNPRAVLLVWAERAHGYVHADAKEQ